MKCDTCQGDGIHVLRELAFTAESERLKSIGLPGGWVQKCDWCAKYDDDLQAFNARRRAEGFASDFQAYPFSIVDRDDATEEHPLEQFFLLTACYEKYGRKLTHSFGVTVRNEGELADAKQLVDSLEKQAARWLFESGIGEPMTNWWVDDCLPVEMEKA